MNANTKAKRILVIDDSEIVLSRMKRALTAQGYEVITTTQVVGNARYLTTVDLVIIDYHMPGLNGSNVVESLRAVAPRGPTQRSAPLYLYTSDNKVAENHVSHGFDGAFTEKGDEAALVRQVSAVFRLIEMRAARGSRPNIPTGNKG